MNIENKFKLVMYIGVINIMLAILVTGYNIFAINDYTQQLINFSLITLILLIIVTVLNLGLSVLPTLIGSYKYEWSEKKQSTIFFQSFIVSSLIVVGGACLLIQLLLLPNYDKLMNPFLLNSNELFYSTWWFSSFTVVILVLFVIYVFKVSKEAKKS